MNKFIFKILVPDNDFKDYREIFYTVFAENIGKAFVLANETVSKMGFVDYLILDGDTINNEILERDIINEID